MTATTSDSLTERLFGDKRKLFWIAAPAALVLDLATKALIYRTGDHPPTPVIPHLLNFHSADNTGGVFRLGSGGTHLFIIASIIAIPVLIYYLLTTERDRIVPNLGLGMLMGGALGNLYDRVVIGYVRDFIDLYWRDFHWYTFNVADIFICVGIGLLFIDAFRPIESEEEEPVIPGRRGRHERKRR